MRLDCDHIHVEYPNYNALRLIVQAPGISGFFEAPAGPGAVEALLDALRSQGLSVDPDDLEAAIEMA